MTERMSINPKNISGEIRGYGGKERAIGPFFSPVAVLKVVLMPANLIINK